LKRFVWLGFYITIVYSVNYQKMKKIFHARHAAKFSHGARFHTTIPT